MILKKKSVLVNNRHFVTIFLSLHNSIKKKNLDIIQMMLYIKLMTMKKSFILFVLLLIQVGFAQKRETVRGSKIVTTEQKKIGEFENLEFEDNFEVFLIKGEICNLEIEADDNLHETINIALNGNTLRLTTNKNVSGAKKLILRVTYNDKLKMVTCKHETTVSALTELALENVVFKSFDYSKLFLNAKVKNFSLYTNDKSKVELNLKSDDATIEMSKNSHLKSLISSLKFKLDLYQKADAQIEGDIIDMKLRLDNNVDFDGKNLIVKNMELVAESYTKCSVNTSTSISIEASGNTEIQLYGDQKIDMKKFADNAVLIKKPTK